MNFKLLNKHKLELCNICAKKNSYNESTDLDFAYSPTNGNQEKDCGLEMTSSDHRSREHLLVVAIVTGEGSGNFHLVTELGVLAPRSTTTYRTRLSGAMKQRAKSAFRQLCFLKFLYLFISLFCILFQACWSKHLSAKVVFPFSYSGVSDRQN